MEVGIEGNDFEGALMAGPRHAPENDFICKPVADVFLLIGTFRIGFLHDGMKVLSREGRFFRKNLSERYCSDKCK